MRSLKNPKYMQIALYVFLTAIAIILFTILCLNLDQVKMVWDKTKTILFLFQLLLHKEKSLGQLSLELSV